MRIILLLLLFGAFGSSALASPDIPYRVADSDLFDDATWLRLLHFDPDRPEKGSSVVSPEFFLSADGARSASAEMSAVLEALADPETRDEIYCRFPARGWWLNRRFELSLPPIDCPQLSSWARFDHLESFSLMLISGYFGNPASTFGHSLLKINNGAQPDGYSLLDLGINYGALVPENEATFTYIVRGLFGGYEAGFSDQDFYRYDQTYSRTEFRDMWEYELELSEAQKTLLIYHVWEIAGKKFRYYFLTQNCAYRLAELIELVTGESLTDDVQLWYAPVTLFHSLHALDQSPEHAGLIKNVVYEPSAQTQFAAQLKTLSVAERKAFASVVAAEGDTAPLADLPDGRPARVAEVLLSYYHYRLAGLPDEEDVPARAARNRIVAYRLSLPVSETRFEPAIETRRSPALRAAPSAAGLFASGNEVDEFLLLNYAPFRYDAIGNNALQRSELTVLDTYLRLGGPDPVSLDRLDLIRVRKISADRSKLYEESALSWEVAVGARQERNDCGQCGEVFADFSAGMAWALRDNVVISALGGVSANDSRFGSSVVATLGAVAGPVDRWSAELRLRAEQSLEDSVSRLRGSFGFRYSFSQKRELRMSLSESDGLQARIGLSFNW